MCFLLDVPDVWTHATNFYALLLPSSCSPMFSCLLSLLPTCQFALSQTHVTAQALECAHLSVTFLVWSLLRSNWERTKWIKNRFFFSFPGKGMNTQSWHHVWCQYLATNSLFWHTASVFCPETHICHLMWTSEHKPAKDFVTVLIALRK